MYVYKSYHPNIGNLLLEILINPNFGYFLIQACCMFLLILNELNFMDVLSLVVIHNKEHMNLRFWSSLGNFPKINIKNNFNTVENVHKYMTKIMLY